MSHRYHWIVLLGLCALAGCSGGGSSPGSAGSSGASSSGSSSSGAAESTATGTETDLENGGPGPSGRWSSLAISEATLHWGSAHGMNSKEAAQQLALANCQRNSGRDCKVLLAGANTCLALAISDPDIVYGFDAGVDRASAGVHARAQCHRNGGNDCIVQTAPCASDDPRWPSALPLPPAAAGQVAKLDPNTIGIWEHWANPGRWICEIAPHGTYQFHSEAIDGVASYAGTFSASGGYWSLQATSGWSDGGTYRFQAPDTLVMTGSLGTIAWHHPAKKAADN